MTPAMTPQSATRNTRSQSPPQLTQRRPVSQMQAAMPMSSITPYMCSVSGPRLNVPLDGDGMEPRTTPVTGPLCPTVASAENPDRELRRATALDQLDRLVEVDVQTGGQPDRIVAGEADAHQLGSAPALDALQLRLDDVVCRRHSQVPLSLSGTRADWISPSGGISPGLLDGRCAQQVPDRGEEVGLRVDAVVGAELEQPRAERSDEVDVHRRLAGEVANDARELADHSGRRAPRVDLQANLAPLRRRLERRHFQRDELRLALLLVVDAALDDEDGVLDEQPMRGRVGRVEDDDLDGSRHVLELDEGHRLALLRGRRAYGGDDAAGDDGLAFAAALELGERAVGAPPQLVADRAERML